MKTIINILRKRVAHRLHKKLIKIENQKMVSFTFDDVFDSAFTNGGGVLKKYDANGTFYLSMSFMNGLGSTKEIFTEEVLREALNDGHEMAGHSFGHLSAFYVTKEQLLTDELKNKEEFNRLNLGVKLENFAYPYGDQVPMVKEEMGKAYHSSRGITEGVNRGLTDLNNLKAIRLFEEDYSLEYIYKILDDFNKKGGWLIFYTHEIEENHSRWGCSPQYFEKVVERVVELGIPIETIKESIRKVAS